MFEKVDYDFRNFYFVGKGSVVFASSCTPSNEWCGSHCLDWPHTLVKSSSHVDSGDSRMKKVGGALRGQEK